MKISRIILISIILLIAYPAFSNNDPPTWNPYSPYTGYQGNIDEVHIGFGDWCTLDEGPHPGIDFGDPDQNNGTLVYSPCGTSGTVEWAGYYIDNTPSDPKGMVVCVAIDEEDWGWGVAHLDPGVSPMQYDTGGVQPAFAPMEITFDMSQSNPDWRHVHLYWIHRDPPSGMGFYNPFNYIMGNLVGYDAVSFGSPWYNELYGNLDENGIFFSPDAVESPLNFSLAVTVADFQEIVFGFVDASVRPYSAFQSSLSNDTCGVNTIGYKILWQNPYTEEYEDLDESSLSIFGGDYRLLVSMNDGEMSVGDSDEYRAVFLDGNVVGQGYQQHWAGLNSSYIVTNSGTQSMGFGVDVFNSGWDNVWTDSYDRDADWNDQEYLRGAWDTRLGNSNNNRTALINEQAVFPDGRYAFAVMALSQGTAFLDPDNQEWSKRVLPCDNLLDENSPVTGVVVDNFIPSIDSVKVYSFRLDIETVVDTMYTEEWNVESPTIRERTSTASGYLASENSGLGVAVRYSEIMDPENMGYYWFTGTSPHSVVVYSSENDKSRWLRPVEGFRAGLDIVPSSPEAAYWQCYETSGDCSISALGFIGGLALHIGYPAIPLKALDLAGNEMDYDPSTIATPRDPVTGLYDYSLVESEPYNTGAWWENPAWYQTSAEIVSGYLDGQLVAEVDLEEAGLGWFVGMYRVLVGDCDHWCGFWMFWRVGGEYNEYWPMVDFQGEYTELIIWTEFPVGQAGLYQYWHRHSSTHPVMSSDTRYIWAPGYTVDWLHTPNPESKAYVYCLDSENSIVGDTLLCVGWCWEDTDNMPLLQNFSGLLHDDAFSDSTRVLNASFSQILSVDSNGVAEVRYGYYTAPNPGGLVQDTILIDPIGARDELITTLDERPIETPVAEIAAEINMNPVHDVLTVNLLASSGSRYEIDLYDISGRQVLYDSGILTQDRITINNEVNHLPSGVYLLRVSTGDMEVVRTISIIH